MKYTILIAASNALLCLVGCASPSQLAISDPVGPAPTEHGQAIGNSSLQVYSARVRAVVDPNKEEFLQNNDFGKNDFKYEPAHTDYTICSQDGKVLQKVRNARGPDDAEPAVVPLAPGHYKIEAKARDYGMVVVPVVVESGKLTTVNLQRNRQPVPEPVAKTDMVLLGHSRIIGWRAKEASPADTQTQ
jgi:hypothetical protein